MSDRELVARGNKAVEALRTPDYTFARTPNTIRQSVADVIEELLAALSAAGRLRAEVTGEVVEAAAEAVARHFDIPAYIVNKSRLKDALSIAAPIIAADAERRVRAAVLEEARLKAGAHSCAKYGDHDAQLLAQRVSIDIADAIGALKDKPHAG